DGALRSALPRGSSASSREASRTPSDLPARLGPELVPGVQVLEVLTTVCHQSVLELEDDAVGYIQVLAVSVGGAALDAHHAVFAICSHVLQRGPEGASGLFC